MTPDLRPEALPDHIDRLFRAAWALCGTREDAEDLVQETFVRVLSKRRVIASDLDTLPYLIRALRNTYLSTRRDRQRRGPLVPLEDAEPQLATSLASPPARAEAREVFAAIAALPGSTATPWWRWTWWASPTRRPRGPWRCRRAPS
ncbi:MAG: RNA polymerase sigma factor [Thermoleophilia bacterium]